MTSRKILVVCAAALVSIGAHAQFTHTFTTIGNVPIPASGSGGAPGGTSNAANAASMTVDVPMAFVIQHLSVEVNLSHPAASDLRIEIRHCGTTMLIHNQSPSVPAYLSGTYGFDDQVATTFASAINAAGPNGTVAPGTYQPVASLSVLNWTNSAGAWTVTVYDLAASHTGGLFGLSLTFDGAGSFQSAPTFSFIPDGAGGQCLQPVLRQIQVPTHGIVRDMTAQVFFSHPYVSDLDITIQHDGVSVALSQYAAPMSSADVNGGYMFWDGAGVAWTTIESNYSGTGLIPPGTYRPKQPLSAFAGLDQYGTWYVTVCDRAGNDVGNLGGVALQIERQLYGLALTQPNGPASITLTNSGGVPGHQFVNLFTLAQGSAPAGWVLGLDIPLADLISQATAGAPFTGTLGGCGWTAVTLGGPVPSGLTVWGVSLELDATMTPVATKPVFSYTTL